MNAVHPSAAAGNKLALAQRIEAGAAALALPLSAAQVDALARYLQLLQRWTTTYNLTAIRDPEKMIAQHVLDCLAAMSALRRRRGAQVPGERLLDVGSGAGLPGIVFAVVAPERQVVCVDSVRKKVAFITDAIGRLGLKNVTGVHARVEDVRAPPFDVIASRAFASLENFVSSSRHLIADHGSWMAMKGRVPADELAAFDPASVTVEQLEVPGLDAERCIVWLEIGSGPTLSQTCATGR